MTPDAARIEAALADVLAAHRQSFGSNDGDLWTFCTCDPNVVLLRSGRSDGDVPGMGDPFYIDGDAAFRAHVAAALLPVVTQAQAETLREAADRWTQGAWADVMLPKPTPPAVPVIAYANRFGDWLRARADRIESGGGES